MIGEAVRLFKKGDDLEMRKLRCVATVFFFLWVVDTLIGTFSGCRILQVNAFITFNTCAAVASGVVSLNYCRIVQAPSFRVKEQITAQPNPQPHSLLLGGQEHRNQQNGAISLEGIQGYYFGAKRLHTLISFGASIFVLFGSLTVMLESVHDIAHTRQPSPKLLFLTGVAHALLITVFGGEIDAHDRISGTLSSQREPRGLPSIHVTIRQVLRRPLLLFSRAFSQQYRIIRIVLRSFSAFTCILVSLLVRLGGSSMWETIGVMLLAFYVLAVTLNQSTSMAWLLLNNATCQPNVAAKCERAIRSVQLIPGVMQIKSSCFWEVSEGELMALVQLILLTSADPLAVTQEAHKILASVAAYVFVEVRKPDEEDNFDPGESSSYQCHNHSHGHDHGHSHGHNHDYGHHHHHGGGERHAFSSEGCKPVVTPEEPEPTPSANVALSSSLYTVPPATNNIAGHSGVHANVSTLLGGTRGSVTAV
ncbi:hypothetical protein, conserved [Trypanosoma brucei gambiense DAL972]|uniref:Cation transporter n=1 Tax=Trypanosoma brucei gambiense (strain MHOM/CI/86/DAL972) TaxID=679716 RepID=D0AA69_TRYB9|nr:hypothetical protein, conserved [Trypanosoma brucei gambiense DAL972]CBH18570.1 hypothetical protein, conserved [Trypanosoma brucei gambiense DAL972]|eukprot:XP_011780834.1 hypothetical protein, conserved [Trypanosoma brucei gambiense DAL972]